MHVHVHEHVCIGMQRFNSVLICNYWFCAGALTVTMPPYSHTDRYGLHAPPLSACVASSGGVAQRHVLLHSLPPSLPPSFSPSLTHSHSPPSSLSPSSSTSPLDWQWEDLHDGHWIRHGCPARGAGVDPKSRAADIRHH